jgi:hypothetical protein
MHRLTTEEDLRFVWQRLHVEDQRAVRELGITWEDFVRHHIRSTTMEYDGERCVYHTELFAHVGVNFVWQFATWGSWRAKRYFRKQLISVLDQLSAPAMCAQFTWHQSGTRWLNSLGFEPDVQAQNITIWRRKI